MTERWSQTTAKSFRSQHKLWKREPDYRMDVVQGVILTVKKYRAGGKLVGTESTNRAERRSRYMVRVS